jgi:ABC-2 type transport system permease protein
VALWNIGRRMPVAVMTPILDAPGGRVSFGRVLRSEWIKYVTLRSNLPIFVAVVVGLGFMGMLPAFAASADSGLSAGVAAQDVLGSMSWVQLLVAIPAVVLFGSEYTSGSARVTFLAVPARIPVLLAKQLAVAMPAGAAGAVGGLIAFAGTALLLDVPPAVQVASRAVMGAGLYLAAIAALSVAVAAIIRDLVGAMLTVAALLTVAPFFVALVPISWVQRTAAWLPSSAGQLVFLPDNPDASLSWWGGYLVLLAWTAGATVIAGVLLRTRDV